MPVDVTADYIRIRQKDPELFIEDSFRTVELSKAKGIKAVMGKLQKAPEGKVGSMVIQSYLFDKEKWTTEKAKAWVEEHAKDGMSAFGAESVEEVRDAKLFEAGDYTDTHGIEITEDDLDALIAEFPAEGVPIKLEHTSTPIDKVLGAVVKVWRKGKELFGRIAFNPAFWALAEAAGARKLSVGLSKAKKLMEVSLVSSPRVKTAEVFASFVAGDISEYTCDEELLERFSALLNMLNDANKGVITDMADETGRPEDAATIAELSERISALEGDLETMNADLTTAAEEKEKLTFELRQKAVGEQIEEWKRSELISDSEVDLAAAILLYGNVATEDEKVTLADKFTEFVKARKAAADVKPGDDDKGLELTDADEDLLVKLGLKKEDVEKYAVEV